MKKITFAISLITIPIIILCANESDWSDNDSWGEEEQSQTQAQEEIDNTTFEKVKIKNRSKKEYDDKVYKYITGEYKVKNNEIELATVKLNDNLKSKDIEVNVLVDGLKVEGDEYKDSIDIKRDKYKNFVNNDENDVSFLEEEDSNEANSNDKNIKTAVTNENPRYSEVKDKDVSQIEVMDLRKNNDLKEVNVFMENVKVRVH